MAEDNVMRNIDIKDFGLATSLNDTDYVVLSLGNGTSARASVALLKSVFTAVISPSVKNGVWFVGDKSLDVSAEGKTPEMRRGTMGIEWKYTTEDTWKLLVSYTDIKLQFDMLSNEQKAEIITGVNEQVHAEVIQPVTDAVTAMQKATNTAIYDAKEATREANEATEAANKYANRVKDITPEEWEELERNQSWEQGVEYNVYEQA